MKIKRFICLILCAVILTTSISITYTESAQGAEVAAGVVTYLAAHKILTALLVAGTVVAGGIAYDEISNASPLDTSELVNTVKDSFHGFVTEYQKNLIIQNNAQISEQEAIAQATEKATSVVKNFSDNALNVTTTTGSKLKTETVDLWQEYGKELNEVLDSDSNSSSGSISPTTTFNAPVYNYSSGFSNIQSSGKENVGANCFEYDGNYYVGSGTYFASINSSGVVTTGSFSQPTNVTDRNRFWFGIVSGYVGNNIKLSCNFVDVNKLTGQIITSKLNQYTAYFYYTSSITTDRNVMVNTILSNTNMPCFVIDSYNSESTMFDEVVNHYNEMLPINSGGNSLPQYMQLIASILSSNVLLRSISTGRRRLIANGDYVGNIFEDSYPVKKNGLSVDSGTSVATGSVGWDLPFPNVWDKGIVDVPSFPDVVGGTGTVAVPKDSQGVTTGDTTVSIPDDIPVTDSTPDEDSETPEKTPEEVIQEQGGNYYPNAFDLTDIFPFCIPFDIIYLVNKFDASGETAPVITIPIVYPTRLQGTLGESYDIVIDFQDYVMIRNVIRVFILLLFIIGLMQITRSLIRG